MDTTIKMLLFRRDSLLDLVAAVGTCVADNELQFLAGILNKLALEGSLLRFRGPGEALVHIKEPVKAKRECNQSPAHGFPDLRSAQKKMGMSHWLGRREMSPNRIESSKCMF